MAETTTTPPADPAVTARKSAATRKTNAVKRSTAAKKSAQTRAANAGTAARKTATTRTRSTAKAETAEAKGAVKTRIAQAADVVETTVLVPVGAALVTRDRVMEAIDELRSTYSTRTKTEATLKRFERRGSNAIKPLVRDAKKTRARVEKELRYGRSRIEKDVKVIVRDFEPVAKNVELVSARVENAVQSGKTAATKAATTVQERVAAIA